jgi:general secretion pathway protein G
MTKRQNTVQPGFSFIEMMIAVVIIGILGSLIGPKVFSLLGRTKTTATKNTLKVTEDNITQYYLDTGSYPEKLDDLIKKPENANNWNGPYAGKGNEANPELPNDAWDQPLKYKKNERGVKPPFELYSEGDPTKEENRIYAK